MESLRRWLTYMRELDIPLFALGDTQVTLWGLIAFFTLIVMLVYAAGVLQRLTANRLLSRAAHLDISTRQAIASMLRYVFLLVGFLIIVQAFGINLTTLNVLVGAVGVGVGFGLQNIISNWISGLIIMFERPVRIGDWVEVGGIEGGIAEIGARRTTVLTKDDTAVIIPNTRLITENVINWQYYTSAVSMRLAVGVSHECDPHMVSKLLEEAALENPDVMKDPAPRVNLVSLGGAAFAFELLAWTQLVRRKNSIISALNFAVNDKFTAHNVKLA